MSDEKLREAYAKALPTGADRPPLDDLAAERLRKLVEREGREEDRLHTLDTLLSTAEGRRELEIVWAAARAARPPRARWTMRLIAAGLVATVGVTGTWWWQRPQENLLRSDTSPITLVAPIGTANAATKFVWRALPDAERYMFVVVDSAGNEVYAAETRDTAVTMPDSVRLRTGGTYLWWVQATTRLGASVTAVTQRVVISGR